MESIMINVFAAIVGFIMLSALVWMTHRLRMGLGGEQRDRVRSGDQAQSEAEILTRSRGSFI